MIFYWKWTEASDLNILIPTQAGVDVFVAGTAYFKEMTPDEKNSPTPSN